MFYYFDKNTLADKKVSIKHYLLVLLGIAILTFILSIIMASYLYKEKIITEEARMIVLKEQNEFSKDKLKEYILQLNIKFPYIVLAQSELESGNYKSPIFRENNNFFGMKCARLRPTTNKGINRGHAMYDNWRDCIVDYAFYSATYLNDIKSESEYLQYLKENYAEDPNYIEKLRVIIKKNKKIFGNSK